MVVNRQQRLRVAVKPLEKFLERVKRTLRLPEREVSVRLVSDAAMARLNQTFRGKRGPTDVLAFPANHRQGRQSKRRTISRQRTQTARSGQGDNGAAEPYSSTCDSPSISSHSCVGDIAISAESARRNARRFARALPQELRILILHGMLHLAGYDHETDHGEMDRLERRLRRRLGLS